MPRVSLTGGAYTSRDIIESAQRLVNLYPEQMSREEGEPSPVTYLPTPGLSFIATSPTNQPCRGLFRASNGDLYGCWAKDFYYIDKNLKFTKLGSFVQNARTPIAFIDNGVHGILSDGSSPKELQEGFTFKLKDRTAWKPIPANGWLGSTFLDFTDTFIIANYPGTPTFYISGSEDITFDPLDFAGKSAKPDNLVAAVVSHRVIWLIGKTETELFYNTGGGGLGTTSTGVQTNTFPFEIMPGVSFEDGVNATYSIVKLDTSVIWLAQNPSGAKYLLLGTGYKTQRVSNHAIEDVWNSYKKTDDAVAFGYVLDGHYMYQINFPSADVSWTYDLYTKLWFQKVWLDIDGGEHRDRASFHAYAYGKHYLGDWENGALYTYDFEKYKDGDNPIKRLRTFPQQIDADDNNRIRLKTFTAEISVGQQLDPNDDPIISLYWSDDGGHTWSNKLRQSLGRSGAYRTNVQWSRLGMARDRVWALEWSSAAKVSLKGAFITFDILSS